MEAVVYGWRTSVDSENAINERIARKRRREWPNKSESSKFYFQSSQFAVPCPTTPQIDSTTKQSVSHIILSDIDFAVYWNIEKIAIDNDPPLPTHVTCHPNHQNSSSNHSTHNNSLHNTLTAWEANIARIEYPLPRTRQVKILACGDAFTALYDSLNTLWMRTLTFDLSSTLRPIHEDIIISELVCGENHGLVISRPQYSSNSELMSFGCGLHGQLGVGELNEWSGALKKVNIPPSTPAVPEYPIRIAAGVKYSMVVTSLGNLYTFGWSPHMSRISDGESVHMIPTLVEQLVGVGYSTSGNTGIALCACGPWHCIAVAHGSNDVYGWGWNRYGQMGQSAEGVEVLPKRILDIDELGGLQGGVENEHCEVSIVKVTCGSTHTALLTSIGRIIVMGQLGVPDALEIIKDQTSANTGNTWEIESSNKAIDISSSRYCLATLYSH